MLYAKVTVYYQKFSIVVSMSLHVSSIDYRLCVVSLHILVVIKILDTVTTAKLLFLFSVY